jgi:hypothetical protein
VGWPGCVELVERVDLFVCQVEVEAAAVSARRSSTMPSDCACQLPHSGGCQGHAPGWQHASGSQGFLEPVLDIRVLVEGGHLSVPEPRVHRASLDEVASHV